MSEERNAERVNEFYTVMLTDFAKAANEMMTEDIQWVNPLPPQIPFGGIYQGVSGLVEYFEKLDANIEMHPLNFTEIVGSGDIVSAIGIEEDTLVKPTGKRYTMPFVHVIHFNGEGRVNYVREYNDITNMLAAFDPDE